MAVTSFLCFLEKVWSWVWFSGEAFVKHFRGFQKKCSRFANFSNDHFTPRLVGWVIFRGWNFLPSYIGIWCLSHEIRIPIEPTLLICKVFCFNWWNLVPFSSSGSRNLQVLGWKRWTKTDLLPEKPGLPSFFHLLKPWDFLRRTCILRWWFLGWFLCIGPSSIHHSSDFQCG